MNLPSKILEETVTSFARLPGVGRKTALRYVLHLLRQDAQEGLALAANTKRLLEEVQYCSLCHNITEGEQCEICSNHKRNHRLICVVESVKDVLAVESTQQYSGVYHVLGGIISPIDGIGPGDLHIASLEKRVEEGEVDEVIFALSATMEGDTTNFFIYKKISDKAVILSTLARGVSVGSDLEYADEVTLGRSITHRMPYESSLKK